MPSDEVKEAPEESVERQEIDRIKNREEMAKIKLDKEARTSQRKAERRAFLQPAMSFEDMYRQSDARVYFMKTNRLEFTHPDKPTWNHHQVAEKLLSRFKYNKKKADENEAFLDAAIRIGNEKLINEYKAEADKYLTKCLFAHYGIGVLYTQFISGIAPVV